MTKSEVYAYFDEHWNDYNAMHLLLDKIFDLHERQLAALEYQITHNNPHPSHAEQEIERLKELLQNCRDHLDEETHKLLK
ncbi:MAG: hypothetical protein AB7S65_06470 [Sulfuricurvum sp.]